ncbi:MAG: hypothetical protein Q9224_005851 [Gallowayella concinna]
MHIPNEVLLNILANLQKLDLKRARLVCQTWASLSAEFLFETIYISPRETDLAVFDAITQHPVLRRAPRHLIYDCAVFSRHDQKQYLQELYEQFDNGLFSTFGSAESVIREMLSSVPRESIDDYDIGDIAPQLANYPVFIEGYRKYFDHAKEQYFVFYHDWSERVCRGLESLGPITFVTMRNTWDMIYDKEILNNQTIDYSWDMDRDELISLGRIQPDGKRLIGSPSARAWPPTALLPQAPQVTDDSATLAMIPGRSSGDFEFKELVDLLVSTGKQQEEFRAVGNWDSNTGIPLWLFCSSQCPESINFRGLASHLKVLQLELTASGYGVKDCCPALDNLKHVLCRAHLLEVLSLTFPMDYDDWANNMPYRFHDAFPRFPSWLPEELRSLHIDGISITYVDFFYSLLSYLPSLADLHLGNIVIECGGWEEVIEGLRQCTLESCTFDNSLLYPNGSYYTCDPDTEVDSQDQIDFIRDNAYYVLHGGSHPGLRDGESME